MSEIDNGVKHGVKVALTGKLRSGKSTLQGYAILFYDFQPFAFGDPLKETYHGLFPHVPRNPKPRAAYQKWGQMVRELDKDVWIRATLKKIGEYIERNKCPKCDDSSVRVLITDLRQPNEYKRLKEEGYTIIRVNADETTRIERAKEVGDEFTEEDLRHETELQIDDYEVDFEINNGTGIDTFELTKQFDEIMAKLGVEKSEDMEIVCEAVECK